MPHSQIIHLCEIVITKSGAKNRVHFEFPSNLEELRRRLVQAIAPLNKSQRKFWFVASHFRALRMCSLVRSYQMLLIKFTFSSLALLLLRVATLHIEINYGLSAELLSKVIENSEE